MPPPPFANPKPPLAIIPAYNEEPHIGAIVRKLREYRFEVLVVDDCSSDQTAAAARRAGATVVRHCVNLNYGSALQTGYRYALDQGHTTVVQLDGDGQHDPAFATVLIDTLTTAPADLVLGSRILEPRSYQVPWARRLGQRLFGAALNALTGLRITDPTSGYQAMNEKVLRFYCGLHFPDDFPDANILLLTHRMRFRIVERPVVMYAGSGKSMHQGLLRPINYIIRMTFAIFMALVARLPESQPPP